MTDDLPVGLTQEDMEKEQQRQLQLQQAQMDNPFNKEEYRNLPVPDTQISYGGGLPELMLSDNDIPPVIRKKYWWVFNRDNVLTFLDEKRKHLKMMSFDISIIDMMNAMESYDDYTFLDELQFNLIRNALDVKLDRAVGFKGSNVKNERIVLQSQFSEARQINEDSTQTAVREGFLRKLLGRR